MPGTCMNVAHDFRCADTKARASRSSGRVRTASSPGSESKKIEAVDTVLRALTGQKVGANAVWIMVV